MAAVKEKIDPPKCYSDPSKLAACGNITQLEALIEKNASCVAAPDTLGGFPIAWAARSGHSDAVQLLLRQDCDTNAPSWRQLRPLHHAVNGYFEDVVKELLGKEGTDVDAKDEGGTTALHVASGRGVVSICQGTSHRLALIQALVDHKADVNAANAQGATPLHFAANCGQASVVVYLLSKGARPDAADRTGNTPLHVAARVGFPAVIKALLAGGATVGKTNAAGKTPAEVALDADTAHALGAGSAAPATA